MEANLGPVRRLSTLQVCSQRMLGPRLSPLSLIPYPSRLAFSHPPLSSILYDVNSSCATQTRAQINKVKGPNQKLLKLNEKKSFSLES